MPAVEEFVTQAKKRPAGLPIGSPGLRNSLHLAHEYFNVRSGIRMAHVLFTPTPNCPPADCALISVCRVAEVVNRRSIQPAVSKFSGHERWVKSCLKNELKTEQVYRCHKDFFCRADHLVGMLDYKNK